MKKLLIVDDHRLFADGIRFLIEHATDYEVVGVLHTGREVIPFLAHHPIHILLLDIDLPDISGFEVVKSIHELHPNTKVLALSMLHDTKSIDQMIDAGATGYCVKSAGQDELFTALQTVYEGSRYLPVEYFNQSSLYSYRVEHQSLTERETEIIQLIAGGDSTKQIADRLFLSVRTVETHRKNIYRKLGVHTNIELAHYVRQHKLL